MSDNLKIGRKVTMGEREGYVRSIDGAAIGVEFDDTPGSVEPCDVRELRVPMSGGVFFSDENASAILADAAKAEAHLADIAAKAGALMDRLRIADAAHDAGRIAQDFGVDVPHRKEITEVVSNVVTFAPYARHLPFIANNPAASTALDVFLEAGRLLLRAITGR